MGVVVRRYIDFLILLIPTLVSVLFAAASLLLFILLNVFRSCTRANWRYILEQTRGIY